MCPRFVMDSDPPLMISIVHQSIMLTFYELIFLSVYRWGLSQLDSDIFLTFFKTSEGVNTFFKYILNSNFRAGPNTMRIISSSTVRFITYTFVWYTASNIYTSIKSQKTHQCDKSSNWQLLIVHFSLILTPSPFQFWSFNWYTWPLSVRNSGHGTWVDTQI